MKDLLLSIPALRALLFQLTRDAGFRIGHTIRSSHAEPNLRVIFDGPDSGLLRRNDDALLKAIQHFVAEALNLDEIERSRIAFNLKDEQADLRWEFRRCYETIAVLPERTNASCVSDELWEQLAHHPHGMAAHSMN